MRAKAVLAIDRRGTVRCLYTETIDLCSLGPLKVRRATAIGFDHETQRWVVRGAGGGRKKILFAHRSREQCLRWEQQNIGPS